MFNVWIKTDEIVQLYFFSKDLHVGNNIKWYCDDWLKLNKLIEIVIILKKKETIKGKRSASSLASPFLTL